MSILTKDEFRRLGTKEFHGYGTAAFPDQRDLTMDHIVARLEDGSAFSQTSAQLTPSQRNVFGAFALRAASIAVQADDPDMVRKAIIAIAMALDGSLGNKDELLQVPLPLRSAEHLGLDLPALMDQVTSIIPDATMAVIRGYADCDDLARMVGEMGYEERGAGQDFRYVFTAW